MKNEIVLKVCGKPGGLDLEVVNLTCERIVENVWQKLKFVHGHVIDVVGNTSNEVKEAIR